MTAGPAPGRAADPARTIFFGSGSFAVPILDAVAQHPRLRLVAVVTAPDRPAGSVEGRHADAGRRSSA